MEFRQKRKIIKILLLLSILGILVSTLLIFLNQKKYKNILEDFKPYSKLANGKGISFVEYHGDKKIYSVSIDNFSVERAKLGPFAIGPLHVAYLNKVIVDLYLDGMESRLEKEKISESGKIDFEHLISNIKKNLSIQIRKIKGIKIDKISLNLWENEKRIFRISSDTATVDRKTGDLIFTGHAVMDANQSGKLISHRIRWNRKTHFFKVTDPFILLRNGKRIEGKEIETDFLFKQVNY